MHVMIVHFIYKNVHIVKVWWWLKSIVSLYMYYSNKHWCKHRLILNFKTAKYIFPNEA